MEAAVTVQWRQIFARLARRRRGKSSQIPCKKVVLSQTYDRERKKPKRRPWKSPFAKLIAPFLFYLRPVAGWRRPLVALQGRRCGRRRHSGCLLSPSRFDGHARLVFLRVVNLDVASSGWSANAEIILIGAYLTHDFVRHLRRRRNRDLMKLRRLLLHRRRHRVNEALFIRRRLTDAA